MRCRPGDLAVIVNDDGDCLCNIGAFITVVEPDEEIPNGSWKFTRASRPLKCVDVDDGSILFVSDSDQRDGFSYWVEDRHLRPIRPGDGADETLTWAGKPERVIA